MKRRDILKTTALMTGYALSAGTIAAVMNGCKADPIETWTPTFFDSNQINLITDITERIIPKTDTPGANDALVHRFIDEGVRSNFTKEDADKFKAGLQLFDKYANDKFQNPFVELDENGKDEILQKLADEHKADVEGEHIFPVLRELTVAGYMTSEIGATHFLAYDPIPGEWDGCYDYSNINTAWSLY